MILDVFKSTIAGPWETAGADVQFRIDGCSIYFQGSVSGEDWKTNFNFPVKPYRDMPAPWLAHGGFVKAWKSARETIMPRIKDFRSVYIFGYSLGGAMAQLCHEDIAFNYPGMTTYSYTFGSPRVFYLPPRAIRERLYGHIRFHNVGDIVPHMPPAIMGYRHAGADVSVGSLGHFLKTIFPIKAWDQLPGAKMHLTGAYLDALEDGPE
jgi:hypothetical protein